MKARKLKKRPHYIIRLSTPQREGKAYVLDSHGKLIKDDTDPDGFKSEKIKYIAPVQHVLRIETPVSFSVEPQPYDQWLLVPSFLTKDSSSPSSPLQFSLQIPVNVS